MDLKPESTHSIDIQPQTSTRFILSPMPENINSIDDPIANTAVMSESFKETIREIVRNSLRNMFKKDSIEKSKLLEEKNTKVVDKVNMCTDISLERTDNIPDIVKYIKVFSGKSEEYRSWRRSVEQIIKIYDVMKGTPKYYLILHTIRKKIVGEADKVLKAYNIPVNWADIVKCLNLIYADKRDINTLDEELMTMIQGNCSIREFNIKVSRQLCLILDKIESMGLCENGIKEMSKIYRTKALDTFIRGLNGDLPMLLTLSEPKDLLKALELCLRIESISPTVPQQKSRKRHFDQQIMEGSRYYNPNRYRSSNNKWRSKKFNYRSQYE